MWKCLVLEDEDEGLAAAVEKVLLPVRDKGAVIIKQQPQGKYDMAVVSAGFRGKEPEIQCFAAIVPGYPSTDLGFIKAETIITYGMSQKDTITVSSINDLLIIALRREIITLEGKRIEEQEFPYKPEDDETPDNAMAAAAAALVTGMLPHNALA